MIDNIDFFPSEVFGASWGMIPLPPIEENPSGFVRGYFAYQKPIEDIIQPQFDEAL